MLIIKAKLESSKKLKTKTNLIFSTKEEIGEIELIQLVSSKGYLAFNADVFKKEVEEVMRNTKIGVDKSGKSPSFKLRAELYQVWFHDEEVITFEDFYVREMTIIENHYAKKY